MNYSSQQQQAYNQSGSQHMQRRAGQTAPPPLKIDVWGATDRGRQREGNEDAVYPHSGVESDLFEPGPEYVRQKGRLLIVADGVGGARAGSQASRWAIRVAVETYYDQAGSNLQGNLRTAIEQANSSLYQYLQSTGMQEAGSTMTAAVIHGNTLYVANVGDSRAYLLRNGELTQLTRDHTLTQQKLERGLIRPEQVEMDPDRSVLTRSMGGGPTVQVEMAPSSPQQLTAGDVVLLCSDGLTDMLDDQEIARVLNRHSPRRAAKKLIDTANKRGGLDNISVLVAQAGGKGAGGGGLLAGLGGLAGDISDMDRRKKIFLGIGAAVVTVALCGMTALGWSMANRDKTKKTPTPAVTTQPTATAAPAATATQPKPTVTEPQPTDTVPAGAATSTPLPTPTPTDTPLPDRDGDGVLDQQDECPDLSGGSNFNGCPDDDGDGFPEAGFPDKLDQCPGEAGPVNGCPDTDGDGVPDKDDDCPNQWGPPENAGCPTGGDGGDGEDGGDGGEEPTPKPTRED